MQLAPKSQVFYVAILATLALDQLTKWWTVQNIRPYKAVDDVVVIANWFSIAHAKNKGAAFSALDDFEYRLHVFGFFTIVAVVVLVQGFRQLRADDRFQALAMGLILSGALGNAIDRALFGQVTDMFKVYAGSEPLKSWFISNVGTNVWPIFNVADSCIVVGVSMFALGYLFEKDRPEEIAAVQGKGDPAAAKAGETHPSLD